MYAIVRTGGKQYRVERGQHLLVERLPGEEGSDVALEPILYRSEEAIFDRERLAGVKVTARIVGHERGEKLRVFKFKPKRGYKRRTGHRQELTRIEVTDISAGKARAAKPAAEKADEQAASKPAAKAAPKPAAKASKPAAKAAKDDAKGSSKAASKPSSKPASKPAAKPKEQSDGA